METFNLIHRSDQLHQDAGTFYHNYYEDADRVGALMDSLSWAWQDLLNNSLDASRLFVRSVMPWAHSRLFQPVRVFRDVYTEGRQKLLTYGTDGIHYGHGYYYNHPTSLVTGAVELPEGVMDVQLVCDLPVDPSRVLIKNEDFTIQDGLLIFRTNLFETFPVNEQTDLEDSVVIYLRGVTVDRGYVQDRLGVLTQARGTSTKEFQEFCNLIMDCVQEGTTYHRVPQMVCKIYDVPCTQTTETVRAVGSTDSYRWLATDRQVYFTTHLNAFLYSPGDTVQGGTILTDAIRPIRGRYLYAGVPIVLERRFLGAGYTEGLSFQNEQVRLTWDEEKQYWTFPITGREEDIDRFWDEFYHRVEDPRILWNISRSDIVNPAEFIYDYVLYPRAQFYVVDMSRTGPDRLPGSNTRIFRGLMPPGVLFAILGILAEQKMHINPDDLFWESTSYGSATVPVTQIITLQDRNHRIKPC